MAILPKIEEAITEMAAQFPDEKLQQLTITEQPSAGRAEKYFIFMIQKAARISSDSMSGRKILHWKDIGSIFIIIPIMIHLLPIII